MHLTPTQIWPTTPYQNDPCIWHSPNTYPSAALPKICYLLFPGLSLLAALAPPTLAAPATEMPGVLGEVSVINADGKVVVVGEAKKGNDQGPTYVYDVDTGTWSTVGDSRPFVGDHHGAEMIDGKLYLFGGLEAPGTQTAVQIFDPVTGLWSLGPEIPFNTGSPNTALIGDYVYVCGGIDEGQEDTVNTCAK